MSESRTGQHQGLKDAAGIGDKLGPQVAAAGERIINSGDLGQATSEIKNAASDLTGAAVEQGKQFYESAKAQATSYVDERKNAAAQSVSDLAASLRSTGDTFGERPNIKAFVGSAAEGLEQLATGIQDRSFAELYEEAEPYARRSPVTLGAPAALAGFLLARFIKSSAAEASQASYAARSRSAQRNGRGAMARRPASTPFDV